MEKVYLNDIDLHNTYGLILGSIDISTPERRVLTIDVPGRDGVLDITDQLYSEPKYRNRTIELKFFNVRGLRNQMDWPAMYSTILTAFHGKVVRIRFSKDPNHYFQGRCNVGFEERGGSRGFIMTFDCEPYKYSVADPTVKSL